MTSPGNSTDRTADRDSPVDGQSEANTAEAAPTREGQGKVPQTNEQPPWRNWPPDRRPDSYGYAEPQIWTDADRWEDYAAHLTERRALAQQQRCVGVASGLPQLDESIGGLQGVTVIAGPTQSGKTSLACQFLLAGLRADPELAVLYFLLDEMSADDLFDQLICYVAKVDHRPYVTGPLTTEERVRVRDAMRWYRTTVAPRMLTVDKSPCDSEGLGFLSHVIMRDYVSKLLKRTQPSRLMIVIDMFEDLPLPVKGPTKHIEQVWKDPCAWRLDQVMALFTWTQKICSDGWPILVLAKLRKLVQGHVEPTLDDLLGGVALGYKAKRVFFLTPNCPTEEGSAAVPVTLRVMKGRHGRTVSLPLLFHHTQFTFKEASGDPAATAKTRKPRVRKPGANAPPLDPLAGL
jgi:hypothetical protein